MTVSIITPTRDRPVAFAICERYIRRAAETFGGSVQWIIADDGDEKVKPSLPFAQHLALPPPPTPVASLPTNLDAGLQVATGDVVLVMEDDDWYAPGYIDFMVRSLLEPYTLVGERRARYYNVRDRRYFRTNTMKHASLARTGFARSVIPAARRACAAALAEKSVFIDLILWGAQPHAGIRDEAVVTRLFDEVHLSVGMKALPGRGGLGSQHGFASTWTPDRDLSILRSWIGNDAAAYEAFHDPRST